MLFAGFDHEAASRLLRSLEPAWCSGRVSPASSPVDRTFVVCLIATDQLSVDDRRCRPGS